MMRGIMTAVMMLSLALVNISVLGDDLTGVITDTKCADAHKGGSEKDASCIKKCVKSGSGKLALLAGDKLYTITNPDKAAGHEGHTMTVTGKTDEDAKTITIDTLAMAQ
jgi:hypothetical protein